MSNDNELGANTDFIADVVRVKVNDDWVDMAKTGRSLATTPTYLEAVD